MFFLLIIKALLIKKRVKSSEVIGFLPVFFGSFSCIPTLYFFAKLATISFFLRGLLGNTLSALLRERCLVALCLNDNVGASINQSINQLINQWNIIHFTIHKYMFKNLQDYLGNKIVFVIMDYYLRKFELQWKMLDWDSRGYHQQLNH